MHARLPDIWIREGEGEARVSQVCKICAKSFTISYKYKYKSYLEENIGRQNKETTTEIVSALTSPFRSQPINLATRRRRELWVTSRE